jgi:3-phenylpropionate/trans-cinnamate dioxygenase ferredoxin subunit
MVNYNYSSPAECDFIKIGPAEGIPNGSRLFVEVDGQPIVVFNVAGGLYAIADLCSHDDGPLGDGDLEGYEIICPRHGARFDVRTGKVLTLPAVVDISAYPVRVKDGQIEIGLPKKDNQGTRPQA